MNTTIQATELTNIVQIGEDELLLDDLDLVELVVNVLSHHQMERPIGATHPSLRTMLQMSYSMMADYLRQHYPSAVNRLVGRLEPHHDVRVAEEFVERFGLFRRQVRVRELRTSGR